MPPPVGRIKRESCYHAESMKLRILGDSLRLRLSQSDVRELSDRGRVQETIHFGPGAALTYALVVGTAGPKLEAGYEGDTITVRIPEGDARRWIDTEQVALCAEQPLRDDVALRVLIEKDFQCLVPRPGEEDADGFPHPEAGSSTTC